MAPDALLLSLYLNYDSPCHLFFVVCVFFLVHKSTSVNNTQSYKLLTRQGWETSYPEEGGQMVMTCTSDDPTKDVYIVNGDIEIQTAKHKSIAQLTLNLTSKFIDLRYQCVPGPTLAGGYFIIEQIFCNPFDLIPPIEDCKESQVCVLDKTKKHTCVEKKDGNCFFSRDFHSMKNYFKTSFPTYRTACIDSRGKLDKNNETSYGMCHARSSHVGQTFVGLAGQPDHCNNFKAVKINNREIQQDGVLLEPIDPVLWDIIFDSDEVSNITCHLFNSDGEIVALYTAAQSSKIRYEKGSSQFKTPSKLRLHCVFKALKKSIFTKVISTYILAYSNDMSQYQPELTLTKNKIKSDTLDLECKLTLPEGLFSILWWEGDPEPKDQEKIKADKNIPIKKSGLTHQKHTAAVIYTCIVAVYVFEYPQSFKMIKLGDIIGNNSKNIGPKEFEKSEISAPGDQTKKDSDKRNNDTSSGRSNKNEDDAASSKIHPWVIILIITFVVLLLIAVVGGGLLYWKKSKNKQISVVSIPPTVKKMKSIPATAKSVKNIPATVKSVKSIPPTIKSTKSTEAPKPAPPGDLLLAKMQSTPDHAEVGFIYAFHSKMKELLVAGFGDITNQLKKYDFLKRITNEWERLQDLPIPADAGYISTCRYPKNIIVNSTWVHNKTASLAKRPKKYDGSSNPTSLHMSKFKGLTNTFYLCQAPLKTEMPLFLEYIFINKITTLITLFSDDDGFDFDGDNFTTIQRYFDYFDLNPGKECIYGGFSMLCTEVEDSRQRENGPVFRARQVVLKQISTNKTILIRILAFFGWKDFESVDNVDHIVKIYEFMTADKIGGDILVHCSAGWGRTATYIACAVCFQYLESHPLPISIFELVKQLRSDRYGSIQSINQYALVYWAVAHYMKTKFKKQAPKDEGKTASIGAQSNPFAYRK